MRAKFNERTQPRKNPHVGSSLDDFLKQEGIFEEVQTQAIGEVKAWQRKTVMRKTENRPEASQEIRLNAKQYDAFVAALEAPAKPRPRLERLLTTPSVLKRQDGDPMAQV